jgi:hypothetical protein
MIDWLCVKVKHTQEYLVHMALRDSFTSADIQATKQVLQGQFHSFGSSQLL